MNLIEGIQQQCDRCRELLKAYEAIGPAGTFGAIMIREEIKKAEKALASDDTVEMLAAYKRLEECE